MFHVLRRNGLCEELPEVFTAFLRDGQLLCYGSNGQLVRLFIASSIVAYGSGKSLERFTGMPEKAKRRRSRSELLALSVQGKQG